LTAKRKEEQDMRVEAYNQVQQIYQSQKLRKTQASAGTARTTDRVQISSMGKDFQTAKAAVAAAPDIREDLTASIKEKVQNGSYSVDNDTFADKLLKKYEEMR
jgi:negative regulator of flagellin synthesis FlgM